MPNGRSLPEVCLLLLRAPSRSVTACRSGDGDGGYHESCQAAEEGALRHGMKIADDRGPDVSFVDLGIGPVVDVLARVHCTEHGRQLRGQSCR